MTLRSAFFLVLLSLVAANAFAQPNAQPTSRLTWDQDASSLAEAQGYTYRVYPDGGAGAFVLNGVTCANGEAVTTFVCSAPFPAFTPGNHTLVLTAGNADAESLPSIPLAFRFIVVPASPRSLRIT